MKKKEIEKTCCNDECGKIFFTRRFNKIYCQHSCAVAVSVHRFWARRVKNEANRCEKINSGTKAGGS